MSTNDYQKALNEYFKFNFQQLTKALVHFVAPGARPAKITKGTVANCLLAEQVSITDINEYLKTLPYGGSDARFPRSAEDPSDVTQNDTIKKKLASPATSACATIAKPKLDKVPIINTVVAQTRVEDIHTGEVIASGIIGVDNQDRVVSTSYNDVDWVEPEVIKRVENRVRTQIIKQAEDRIKKPVEEPVDKPVEEPVEKPVNQPAELTRSKAPLGDIGIIIDAISELLPELLEKHLNAKLENLDQRIVSIARGEVEKSTEDSRLYVSELVSDKIMEIFRN